MLVDSTSTNSLYKHCGNPCLGKKQLVLKTPCLFRLKVIGAKLTKNFFQNLKLSDLWLENKAKEIVNEITKLLAREKHTKGSQLRRDYKQCVELVLAVVGHTPQEHVSHHCPGAKHSARWMSQMLSAKKCLCGLINVLTTPKQFQGYTDLF